MKLLYGQNHNLRMIPKVIHIADGDTITVLNDTNEHIKIRLNGIDCPEKAQAYGNKAKGFTKELVAGQAVPVCEKAQEC
jgi:endonuclease YncB( thermonuclease family)